MKKFLLTVIISLFVSVPMFGQTQTKIIIPDFKDKYSQLVEKLEAGETDIDYQDFRYSFIESQQFIVASNNKRKLDSLKKQMYAKMKTESYPEVISITKQMLSIDYTNMLAHKILRQTYQIVGDSVLASKYKTIQFGLLNSIVQKGDGQTCATAWPVIQISEEYFILNMLDAEFNSQSTDHNGGFCDKMDVSIEGEKKTYYFEITKVFQGYEKLGIR